jgi:putative ABC transport system substrate-binding protein
MMLPKKTTLLISALSASLGIGSLTIQGVRHAFQRERNPNLKRIAVFAFEDITPLQEIIRGVKDTVSKETPIEIKTFFCHQEFIKLDSQVRAAAEQGYDAFFTIGGRITQKVYNFCRKSKPEIPVIFNGIADPVKMGVVKSLKSTGGNITGVSPIANPHAVQDDISAILNICPYAKKILIPYDHNNHSLERYVIEAVKILERKNITIILIGIESPMDFHTKVKGLIDESIDVVLTLRDYNTIPAVPYLAQLCEQTKSVLFALDSDSVTKGAAISYAPSEYKIGCIAGEMIADVLKDNKVPSQMPVNTFGLKEATELVINHQVLLNQKKLSPKIKELRQKLKL